MSDDDLITGWSSPPGVPAAASVLAAVPPLMGSSLDEQFSLETQFKLYECTGESRDTVSARIQSAMQQQSLHFLSVDKKRRQADYDDDDTADAPSSSVPLKRRTRDTPPHRLSLVLLWMRARSDDAGAPSFRGAELVAILGVPIVRYILELADDAWHRVMRRRDSCASFSRHCVDKLILEHRGLIDDDVEHVAYVLENRTPRLPFPCQMYLSGNDFGSRGASALSGLLARAPPDSLCACSLSLRGMRGGADAAAQFLHGLQGRRSPLFISMLDVSASTGDVDALCASFSRLPGYVVLNKVRLDVDVSLCGPRAAMRLARALTGVAGLQHVVMNCENASDDVVAYVRGVLARSFLMVSVNEELLRSCYTGMSHDSEQSILCQTHGHYCPHARLSIRPRIPFPREALEFVLYSGRSAIRVRHTDTIISCLRSMADCCIRTGTLLNSHSMLHGVDMNYADLKVSYHWAGSYTMHTDECSYVGRSVGWNLELPFGNWPGLAQLQRRLPWEKYDIDMHLVAPRRGETTRRAAILYAVAAAHPDKIVPVEILRLIIADSVRYVTLNDFNVMPATTDFSEMSWP